MLRATYLIKLKKKWNTDDKSNHIIVRAAPVIYRGPL